MPDTIQIDVDGLTVEQIALILRQVRDLREDNALEEIELDPEYDDSWREAPSTGWEIHHLHHLKKGLGERGSSVQLAAFEAALENGGYISRREVYRLGEYDPDRKLNRWTAPFKTVVASLLDRKYDPLPATAVRDVMVTDYGPGTGYRPALGFRVDPELVRLFHEKG